MHFNPLFHLHIPYRNDFHMTLFILTHFFPKEGNVDRYLTEEYFNEGQMKECAYCLNTLKIKHMHIGRTEDLQ